jgi:hypothetical protein
MNNKTEYDIKDYYTLLIDRLLFTILNPYEDLSQIEWKVLGDSYLDAIAEEFNPMMEDYLKSNEIKEIISLSNGKEKSRYSTLTVILPELILIAMNRLNVDYICSNKEFNILHY